MIYREFMIRLAADWLRKDAFGKIDRSPLKDESSVCTGLDS